MPFTSAPTRGSVLAVLAALLSLSAQAQDYGRPKIRAITAFVRLDHASYKDGISAALSVLHSAESEFQKQGYEVETLRIVTQPLGQLVSGLSQTQGLAYLQSLDALGTKEGFIPCVGPAMLRDSDDPKTMRLLEKALSKLSNLQASSIIAAEDGIHWTVIRETAALVHYVTLNSPHSQGNFGFTATAMLKPYGPFYPGAYHDGPGKQLSIGLESANIVRQVFARTHGDFATSVSVLTQQLTIHARIAETVGQKVATGAGWTFMGVDPTPAPLGEDASIAAAMETYTGAKFGSSGTLTAALIITTAVKAVPVKQVGYSGLMIPVMEDKRLAERWAEGSYNTDDLLAYSSVCGTGLDTIPLPGDVSTEQMVRIFGDVASLAWKWNKPLSARLQPVAGKKAGEQTEFSSKFLFNTTLHEVP
jgi:uncharacterized protein (UPF0210 family)